MAAQEAEAPGLAAGADESTGGDFAPLVNATKIEVKTHEEEEEVVFKMRCKLFVFVAEDVYGGEVRKNFWRERGTGDVKLLKHKTHEKVRLLMRQEKTLKICANHVVSPGVEMKSNVGSDRSWVFTALDFADEELKTETFAIKFGNSENANKFKDAIEKSKKINAGEMKPDELKPIDADEEAAPSTKESSEKTEDEKAKDDEGIKLAQNLAKIKVEGDENEDAKVICGGFTKADIDDKVQEAAEFAAKKLDKGELVKVAEAATQVVAGTNFRLMLHIKHKDGDQALNAHLVQVYKPLPHTEEPMELKSHNHIGLAA